eukprot:CAMPEP_0170576124 /NCGR_PEP_ID=MMETSP0224-20130122/4223_1 /TAXON_ID=285029 /ORGANISM="Togula jolla, Strain CCCM 725" /LENGTH=170 /DNA_ID=CAMNT_0010898941 /DNA_START=50 /DNA_END=562 /DNA_ORIENTATION=-
MLARSFLATQRYLVPDRSPLAQPWSISEKTVRHWHSLDVLSRPRRIVQVLAPWHFCEEAGRGHQMRARAAQRRRNCNSEPMLPWSRRRGQSCSSQARELHRRLPTLRRYRPCTASSGRRQRLFPTVREETTLSRPEGPSVGTTHRNGGSARLAQGAFRPDQVSRPRARAT